MSTHSDYDAFDAAVVGGAASMDAAECHGALSGMLCVNRRLRLEEWLAEVFGTADHALDDKALHLFTALFDQTRNELEAFDFGFDLFLPDEDAELSDRAEALSHWCKGFLHGLGSLSEGVACSDDGKEVLRDIYQIAQLQAEGLTDDDEEAYMELAEYLRVGVQLLRTEFQDGQSMPDPLRAAPPCDPAILPDCRDGQSVPTAPRAPVNAKRLH